MTREELIQELQKQNWCYQECDDNSSEIADFILYRERLLLEKIGSQLREIIHYTKHDALCLCDQWREGRPTKDGGYETKYGYGNQEKWYQKNEEPECSCGLKEAIDKALAIIEKESDHAK